MPTIDNTMFARGIAPLQKYLSSVGYMLFLTTSGYDLDAELEQARNLIGRGVDGLVLRGDCHHDGLRKLLADNEVPFMNAGSIGPTGPTLASAPTTRRPPTAPPRMSSNSDMPDRNRFRAPAQQRPRRRSLAGFRRALAENGLELPPEWHVEVPYTLDDAREAARHLLNLRDRPTAVVCGNDVIAYGVLLEAERSGFRCRAICRSSASTTSTGAAICDRA